MTNSDLNMLDATHSTWWYSLITATPTPEDGEAANVAVLLGNGTTSHLAFKPRLPRLSCLASEEAVEALQFVLKSVQDGVARGMDVNALQALIGPQLRVNSRRRLYQEPSDQLVRRLTHRFLEAPIRARVDISEIVARSDAQLDTELREIPLTGLEVLRHVKPSTLYGDSIRRRMGGRVPELARAIRSFDKDVLIDSVAVDRGVTQKALREATGRIGRAFWTYQKTRASIAALENRDLKLVGILHPSGENATGASREMREYIKHVWSADAEVIDGDLVNVSAELQTYAEWARNTR